MKLIIVVGSHLSTEKSVKNLNLMFESVTESSNEIGNIELYFVIGITLNDEKLLELIKLPSNSKLLYKPGERRTQFENLKEVNDYLSKTDFDLNTKLMVIDDDDIMLEMPKYIFETRAFSGIHIVVEDLVDPDLHKYGRKELLEKLEKETEKKIYEDYSGYTMLLKDFLFYFSKNRKRMIIGKSLEDTKFMDYVDKIENFKRYLDKGFIFHRLSNEVSLWKNDLLLDIKSLKELVDVIQKR